MEVREIMADRFNLLVKTFKQANPNLTQSTTHKRVKEYYGTIKNKLDVEKLAREKITEWKHKVIQKRQKNTLISFWKKSKIRYQHQVLTQPNKRFLKYGPK